MLWCLFHNAFGPSRRYQELTAPLPPSAKLNPFQPAVRIAFLGDLLPFPNRRLVVDAGCRALLSTADYLVVNLEGVVLTSKAPRVLMGQAHSPGVINLLAALHPPERTLLTCANNHSGDFGRQRFELSCRILRDAGFRVFGSRENPFLDLPPGIRIASATRWLNRPCDFLAGFDGNAQHRGDGVRFRILCPHWGYEMQRYPHPCQIASARECLESWDMIAGHHSHFPQPVTALTVRGTPRLVAYSLGDLVYRYPIRKYLEGLLLVAGIGPSPGGQWVAGEVEWRRLRLHLRRREATLAAIAPSR